MRPYPPSECLRGNKLNQTLNKDSMKDSWEIKKLGEVCTIKGRIGFRGYTRDDLVAKGEGAITLSPSNIINDVLSFDKCQYISWFKYEESPEIQIFNGDIIYAKTASIGKVALVKDLPEKATINPQFVVFKDIKCYSPYLYYAVKSENFKLQISLITNGVAIPTVSQNNMANLSIPVPPLPTQERIVSELDCINSIIEKKREQLKELDALAQSIFYDMFGDPIHNEKGWEVRKLGEVAEIICGQDYKAVKDDNGEYPIYGTGGIMGYASEYRCPENCTIIGRKGSINNPIFVRSKFWNVDTAFGISPNGEILVPMYFYYFCKNYDFTQHDVSVTIPSLRRVDLLKIALPVPSLPLQQSFASKIEAIEKQKELIKRSIAETETLLASRMQYYFG